METIISYEHLYMFTRNVFLAMHCSDKDATTAANVLLSADLRGIDSHGVARLIGYVRLWESRRANMQPAIRIVHETPSTATVDGDAGLGLVTAPFAMQTAIEKAQQCGTGWVAVKNSNHFGIAGYHAMMALEKDMIGIAMTNASALVAPTRSKERMLGTNPIAFAVPTGTEPPFVADFATTVAANGKLEIAQRLENDIPLGWAQDKDGNGSTQANILKEGGALLPLGSDELHSSYKGYCLGSIVDILTGVLSGASYGPWAPPFPAYVPLPSFMPGQGLGHFFGAMRIDAFRDAAEFKSEMDRWIKRFRNAVPIAVERPVLIPGDKERHMETHRKQSGIPLHQSTFKDLINLGEKFEINLKY